MQILTYGDVVVEPSGRINEYELSVTTQWAQGAVVEFCVLPDPRVAVVQVGCMDVFVCHLGKHHKPLLQELCAESVIGARVCKVHDKLKRFVTEGFERQNDMVDEEVTIGLTNFVATRNIVKDWMSRPRRSRLVENVQRLD